MSSSLSSPSSSSPHSPPFPAANPRRVPVTRLGSSGSGPSHHGHGPGHGLSLKTNTLFYKGATFHHSPTSPASSDEDATFSPPQFSRSQSNLDDVIDAHRRRVALTLDSIGRTLEATDFFSCSSSPKKTTPSSLSRPPTLFFDDTHSVPQGILDHTIGKLPSSSSPSPSLSSGGRRVLQPRPVNHRVSNRHHASDSGLGSSIASSPSKKQQQRQQQTSPVRATAVTRSAAAVSSASDKPAGLSPRATSRIYEHTVKPLLAKPTFKPFHPILLECTTKINKRDIVCLRDLEKTILFLAPVSKNRTDHGAREVAYLLLCIKERTKVAKLYLEFCLESVRCLQTTVEYLNDREQTRPADPPYTAGYFIDLVDQIHHYAQQLADAREKEKSGTLDTMGFHRYDHSLHSPSASVVPLFLSTTDPATSTDEIKLHGGITVNGRPAELVRISRDGRAVSIATGLPVELEEDPSDTIRIKRSASQEREDEEEIMRSMARRKKNAPPEEYAPKMCSVPGCTKEFKRPCDLTKHEKTHSRPWKCPIPSCKYHDYGWPTEKEKDRHLNDKHSDNPPMYECLFKPCTYKSKRDSNRKQHMEKTHGWKYVRTKTNGSSKGPGQGQKATPMPSERASHDASSTTQPTPQLVNLPTPVSAQSPAVATPPVDEFSAPLYAHALAELEFPTCAPGDILAADVDMPAEIDELDFSPLDNGLSPYSSPSTVSSLDNNSAYQDIGQDTTMYEDIYSAPMQLPTPEPVVFQNNYSEKGLLDQFMALSAPDLCAPMITPEQQQQIQRLQQLHQQLQQQRQLQQQQQQQQLQHHRQQPQPQQQQQQQQQQLQQQPLQQQQVDHEQYIPHISPLGEGNTMLYTPNSMIDMDEGFVDFASEPAKKGSDFILFPPAQAGFKTDPVFETLFDETIPSVAAGYSQPTSQVFPDMNW
ncbi:zinc finger transcription factor ace1 [Niveomyces insectorum RCEF 264]|uniref:Zinc finger transcription factor ace1 n=1 Tax=Niveomyces insectorum RCEF 264 TaxID=1081102 RepID=A0A167MUG0_9HYPO|nr:zinc finger transcription factor ace1 [Niveomyces insectorum RCEF 264]